MSDGSEAAVERKTLSRPVQARLRLLIRPDAGKTLDQLNEIAPNNLILDGCIGA